MGVTITNGTWTGVAAVGSATPTASTLVQWDANSNLSAVNLFEGFTSTVTSATPITLTVASSQIQVLTGSTAQTVNLPTTSVPVGADLMLINASTAAVTVKASGGATVIVLAANTSAIFTAVVATPTTAANWNSQYFGGVYVSGKSLTVNNTLTFAGTDGTTFTFPTGTDTVAGLAATQTLSATRVNPRINSTASSATPSINTDTTDEYDITALAAAITSMTTNLTGTPVNGQQLMIRCKDNGTARAITWGTSFASSGVATLLATTVASKTHYIGLRYDSTTAKWICIAVDATGY